MEKLISVIIVTRNRCEQVLRAIDSVLSTNIDKRLIELIIFDNNDDNLTAKEINIKYPAVRIIGGGFNQGVTLSRNKAAQIAKGKYLFFLDDDAWVSEDVFNQPLKVIRNLPNVFAVSSHIRFITQDGYLGPTPKEFDHPSLFLSLTLFENAFMVEREKFLSLGGFNENLFYGAEGGDLSLRAFYKGWFSVYALRSISYHPSNTTKVFNPKLLVLAIKARCISARTSWPWLEGILCNVKAIIISSFRESIRQRSLMLWWNIFSNTVSVLFKRWKKYDMIEKNRFWQFRKIRSSNIELIADGRNYQKEVFGIT